ncbi:MAG: acyl-CoA dehydratase activase [bacterium]|nr:acyl-CoA dehydratase activase [bacterium]
MIVAGCDLGSSTSKVVIMNNNDVKAMAITATAAKPEITLKNILNEALEKAQLKSIADLDYILGTGYGRLKAPLFHSNMSEIACHARGVYSLNRKARTIIDIGGQDCKVISINDKGKVMEFSMNDRCAAGTGRFFESMARALQCGLEDISALSNQGKSPVSISSQCSVFAESEVVTLVHEGLAWEDIIAGINNSVASRLVALVNRIGLAEELVLTGGCAKNEGLGLALQKLLGVSPRKLSQDPQFIGAIGAALLAEDKLRDRGGAS